MQALVEMPEHRPSGWQLRPATGESAQTAARKRRVLVVDDDDAIRELTAMALGDEGYVAATAANGERALELARRERFDLILLDLRMPVMDGREFAERYLAAPGPHAPIVVVSANLDPAEDLERLGAVTCLGKPFGLGELLDIVERHAH